MINEGNMRAAQKGFEDAFRSAQAVMEARDAQEVNATIEAAAGAVLAVDHDKLDEQKITMTARQAAHILELAGIGHHICRALASLEVDVSGLKTLVEKYSVDNRRD